MEFFINELSLNQQFGTHHDFKVATDKFIDLLQAIGDLSLEQKSTFYGNLFFSYQPLRNTRFDTELKSNRDLNNRFSLNLQKLNPKAWESSRVHQSNVSYAFGLIPCTDTSVAEIAERTVITNDYKGILMNFSNSMFSDDRIINVIKGKNINAPILVHCTLDRSSLFDWLTSKRIILPGARKFQHHKQKHDRKKPTPGNAILLGTDAEAQQLLDTAIQEDNSSSRLYNHDKAKGKYIVFNMHSPNTYHGYHVDNENEIPESVRNRL